LICSHSPQAKWRVERANQTLQDRLVKEMKLLKIDSMEAANEWLPKYIEQFNQKFAVIAEQPEDAHISWGRGEDELKYILSIQETRTISKELMVSYHNRYLQVEGTDFGIGLRFAKVIVYEKWDATLTIKSNDKTLPFHEIKKSVKQNKVATSKELNSILDAVKASRPIYKPQNQLHHQMGAQTQVLALQNSCGILQPVEIESMAFTAQPL
jgi:hypothetical protein